MSLTPTVVWRVTPDLVRALDERLGPPLDGYVNGTQTWLTADDGKAASGDVTLEWRLHPVAGFEPVAGISHEDLWDTVAGALADGADPAALPLGDEQRALTSLWDGLECFPAYGDEVEPQVLAGAGRGARHRPRHRRPRRPRAHRSRVGAIERSDVDRRHAPRRPGSLSTMDRNELARAIYDARISPARSRCGRVR